MKQWNGEIKMTNHTQNQIKTMQDKAKSNRVLLWDRIQENDAQMADFLVEFNKIFGKPKKLKVTMHTGEILGEVNR